MSAENTSSGKLTSSMCVNNGSWNKSLSTKTQSEIISNCLSSIATSNSSLIVKQIDANMKDSITDVDNEINNSLSSLKIIHSMDEYPPPYPGSQKSTWPCDSFPNFNFENETSEFIKPELSKLIDKPSSVKTSRISSNGNYQKILINNIDERNDEYYLRNRCEPDTFTHRFGSLCIVIFFVFFLMVVSLAAKLLVTGTLKK